MRRFTLARGLVLGLSLGLIVVACGAAATPTATVPPPIQAPPTPSPIVATMAATPTVAAPITPATPTAARPTAVSAAVVTAPTTAPAAAPATGGGVRFTLVPNESEARYRVREQLAGRSLPNDAVGKTRKVTGAIVLDPAGKVLPDQSRFTVDLRDLTSDESRRDNWIRSNTLQVSRFPNAELVVKEVQALPRPLPTDGEVKLTLIGDLTVHGVTRPTSWNATVKAGAREITGSASTTIKLEDFGMTPPRVGPVLSIEPDLVLEIDFKAAREA